MTLMPSFLVVVSTYIIYLFSRFAPRVEIGSTACERVYFVLAYSAVFLISLMNKYTSAICHVPLKLNLVRPLSTVEYMWTISNYGCKQTRSACFAGACAPLYTNYLSPAYLFRRCQFAKNIGFTRYLPKHLILFFELKTLFLFEFTALLEIP